MKVAGFTVGSVVKIGVAAVLFIVAFKYAAHRSGIPALQSVAEAI